MYLLFDGVCNLCNETVQFILKHDTKQQFKFASLQSEAGQTLLQKFNLPKQNFDTFVFIHNNKCYLKSTAALMVCKNLQGWFYALYVFVIIPKPIRDIVYTFVANNRYKWFGKKNTCWMPTDDLKNRFL